MSNQSIYRTGGIAAILGIVLLILSVVTTGTMVTTPGEITFLSRLLLVLAVVTFVVAAYALYLLFRPYAKGLSLTAVVLSGLGWVFVAISMLFMNMQPLMLYNLGFVACLFAPPLLFGYLALRYRQAGLPRSLAIVGLVAGVAGVINYILVTLGGSDWANPSNPALLPFINIAYFVGVLFLLVWLVWSAVFLLRRRA
jgi:hypothetical protein